ncbi:hypothetical protein DFH08DRAFT_874542 [Mycena albidolilacea]|uniref:Uncharacterized protein n=1 Tax=Mycena albidolilacea TaxID=1033008 RepID=A0AAD6ZVS5_9AGAR|nr:hypothetical protein DFH08DRAFT_874542 [Mycena albidolilacea]
MRDMRALVGILASGALICLLLQQVRVYPCFVVRRTVLHKTDPPPCPMQYYRSPRSLGGVLSVDWTMDVGCPGPSQFWMLWIYAPTLNMYY